MSSPRSGGRSRGVFRPVPKSFFDMTFEEQEAWARELLEGLRPGGRAAAAVPPPRVGLAGRVRRRLRRLGRS